jgi:sigma-B regulation protein RsbU (phosphoserine phosphatase)
MEKPEWLEQMEGILESLNEGVMISDDCHVILFVNECLARMTGMRRDNVLGRTSDYFYAGAEREFLRGQIERGVEQGLNRFEFHLPRADGRRVPVVVSSRMIEDPEGRQYAVVTFTDITEQKTVEEKLRAANEQLEKRQREIEAELALASRVQQSLAPQGLRWGQWAVETFYLPVRTIGGDIGVVTPLGNEHLHLLVCDVSGHGIGSALVANRIYTEAMALVERRATLGETLRQLNSFVLNQIRLPGFYFSMAAARLDASGKQMTFAAAGHPPSLWVTPAGECRLLEPRATVLGAFENAVPPDATEDVALARGDRIVFYTDGLTEVFDQRGEMLGVDGLVEIARQAVHLPIPEMKQRILDQVEAYRHGPVTDDMSLVLVEVL